jgi:hypothetical protein
MRIVPSMVLVRAIAMRSRRRIWLERGEGEDENAADDGYRREKDRPAAYAERLDDHVLLGTVCETPLPLIGDEEVDGAVYSDADRYAGDHDGRHVERDGEDDHEDEVHHDSRDEGDARHETVVEGTEEKGGNEEYQHDRDRSGHLLVAREDLGEPREAHAVSPDDGPVLRGDRFSDLPLEGVEQREHLSVVEETPVVGSHTVRVIVYMEKSSFVRLPMNAAVLSSSANILTYRDMRRIRPRLFGISRTPEAISLIPSIYVARE